MAGFAFAGSIITKFSLRLTEEDAKILPFLNKHKRAKSFLNLVTANYAALSPITFLERAATVYSDRTSIIYERTRFTWKQTYDRCCRLASSLRSLNVSKNDVVSVLAPNIPALYEMHFAVPMAGAVLNTINTRLDSVKVATILRHSEAKVFFVDYQYVRLAKDALSHLSGELSSGTNVALPLVVVIDDVDTPTGTRLGELEYEVLIAGGDLRHATHRVEDEWDPIALNYTSGTTSAPKGVVYSHRGAYLSAMTVLLQWGVGNKPVYLWSLPMFHCNGWTLTWGIAARGGTNVCIRNTCAANVYRSISDHKVTHMCGAPIVLTIIVEARPSERRPLAFPVNILTGGSLPPAPLLEKMDAIGFRVTHAYGLTEAIGMALLCEWQADWNRLSPGDQATLKARQGISVLTLAGVDVKDVGTMESVPRDGRSMGEIVLCGNTIMKGYFKNEKENFEAFKGGWFHTGDVGVIHPDGYVEVKDRYKDMIISGGENISSVEVEAILYQHPAVLEAAVVAMPHTHWGETPCAFLKLKKGIDMKTSSVESVDEGEVISYCRSRMAHFMVPKKVVFIEELPKNATGKIQKLPLRAQAKTFKLTEVKGQIPSYNSNNSNWKKHQNDQPEEQVLAMSRACSQKSRACYKIMF